jgi:hypothetical protein
MSRPLAHLSVAAAQSHSQLVFQLLKTSDLLADMEKLFLQSVAHRGAGLQPCAPQREEFADLLERKPQLLDASDESQYLHIAFAVLAEAARGPRREWE